ncbi:MAG: hypothetical protein JXR34_04700 [Bacteroidales bacterium]|nr:hypothetical protein [Bacteroidales bacterium]
MMNKVNAYLVLPETNPANRWMLSTEMIQSQEAYSRFISKKAKEIDAIGFENYQGYFDNENVANFFEHFDTLEDLYPSVKRKLQTKIASWQNWRKSPKQQNTRTYKIFNQAIENHTIPEIAQHKQNEPNDNYVLLNNEALNIGNSPVRITISGRAHIQIDYVGNTADLKVWFAKNRIPPRNFHVIPKHGENGRGNWPGASPLMCSGQEAQQLLNTAIGDNTDKLYNYDPQHSRYIVFWSENEPENLFHGYHLPLNTNEIPNEIKRILRP